MTTNTISSAPPPVAFPLAGIRALAVPSSGEVAVPPDFAEALAELVAAPATGPSRPKLAEPGKSLPENCADTAAKLPGEVDTDALLPPVPDGDEKSPAQAAADEIQADDGDDATLDPALSWLVVPPPTAPATVVGAPLPVPIPVAATTPAGIAGAVVKPSLAIELPARAETPIADGDRTPKSKATASGLPDKPAVLQSTETGPPALPAEDAPSPRQSLVPRVSLPTDGQQPTLPTADAPAADVSVSDQVLLAGPAMTRDPQLSKLIGESRTAAIAEPLPAAPPRFVATRVTPTIVAPAARITTAPAPSAAMAAAAIFVEPEPIPPADIAKVASISAPSPDRTAPVRNVDPIPTAPAPNVAAVEAATVPPAAPTIAAIGGAVVRLPRPAELRPAAESAATLFASALSSAATAPTTVQPTIDTQSPGMDLTRDSGLHRMIERIEMLRDDSDSRDTRIRLVPDALGPVEVSVRRDGDAVRVHFTAEQPATRALIADAQPRLNELAEARGIKISQTSVDTGSASDGRARPQPQQAAQPPVTPRRARAEASDSSDERIA